MVHLIRYGVNDDASAKTVWRVCRLLDARAVSCVSRRDLPTYDLRNIGCSIPL